MQCWVYVEQVRVYRGGYFIWSICCRGGSRFFYWSMLEADWLITVMCQNKMVNLLPS